MQDSDLDQQILEDWARLEHDFTEPGTPPEVVSGRIAMLVEQPVEKIQQIKRVRDDCAHGRADRLSSEDLESTALSLRQALGLLMGMPELNRRQATDAERWRQEGRCERVPRRLLLTYYQDSFGYARQHRDLDPSVRSLVHLDEFRRLQKTRDEASHPYPPPFASDVAAALKRLRVLAQKRSEQPLELDQANGEHTAHALGGASTVEETDKGPVTPATSNETDLAWNPPSGRPRSTKKPPGAKSTNPPGGPKSTTPNSGPSNTELTASALQGGRHQAPEAAESDTASNSAKKPPRRVAPRAKREVPAPAPDRSSGRRHSSIPAGPQRPVAVPPAPPPSPPQPPPAGPGWYRDPTGRHQWRWYDGTNNTSWVANDGVPRIDEAFPFPAQPAESRGCGCGGCLQSVFWILVLLWVAVAMIAGR